MKNLTFKLIAAASLTTLCLSAYATPLGDALKPIEAKINALTLSKEGCVMDKLATLQHEINETYKKFPRTATGNAQEFELRRLLSKKLHSHQLACRKARLDN